MTEVNAVHGDAVHVADPDADVVLGRFDHDDENGCILEEGCWTPFGTAYTGYAPPREGVVDASDTNGVRVTASHVVDTLFSDVVFGKHRLGVTQTGLARLPITPGVGCAFPLTMPQCAIDQWMTADACDKTVRLRLSSSQVDTVSWSRPADGSTQDTLEAVVDINGDSCSSSWSASDVGDGEEDVKLINGQMNTAFHILQAQLDASTYETDLDGDGVNEILDYTNARVGWDESLWGPNCPGTLDTSQCNPETQGVCDCPNGGSACLASETQTVCGSMGGGWVSACPDAPADCENGVFLRRQMAVFDNDSVSCDANGNVNTQSSWNYNSDEDVTGFVTMLIYNIESQGGDKYLDAYISCLDAQGEPTDDTNGDGRADAVHDGSDEVVEHADKGGLAMVK
ncbi:MAG: hypothetical protein EP330_11595 [Deltaproteobacteria bacterium]|nr:MAG: hypothetical protein EP330_11595 [Deltaproteobacteria bacterium]